MPESTDATRLGINRTGLQVSPQHAKEMLETMELIENDASGAHATPGDADALTATRLEYIAAADPLGSVPPPATLKGAAKSGAKMLTGRRPQVFIDKLAERLAFERGGTRLYDALITKFQAVQALGQEVLPPAEQVMSMAPDQAASLASVQGESPLATLTRIRNEELAHFRMLGECIVKMGGDPTAMTPCADVVGTATMGIMQVVTDPRTTLAQSLNAILSAELTDGAGWEMLVQLAEDAGETDMAGKFLGALSQEQEHVAIVKGWLTELVSKGAGSPAV